MSQTLTKPVLLDETGQDIVDKLDDIKDAITVSGEFTPLMIKVTTPPVKTTYRTGEPLNITGMVVSLVASNGAMIDVTQACTFVPAVGTPLTSSNTSVAISYYWYRDDVTFNTEYPIGVKDLSSITITTAPTKTAYKAGETLDLTGMVVTATYSDGTSIDVTSNCTTSPASGATLTTSDTTITVTYTEGGVAKTATQAITVKGLSSIAITNPPTETSYSVGDTLDLTGIEVTATYSDGSTEDVTSSCTYSPANGATLARTDTTVTASYTEAGVTKTATQSISIVTIYGAEWDGTATTAWTRTDAAASFTDPTPAVSNGNGSSPFDNIQPWAGMVRVTDATAGELVAIPKYYYKWTQDGAKLKLQISDSEFDGSHVSPAHMDRGDGVGERDVIYVGRYKCASNNYTSRTSASPKRGSTGNNALSTLRDGISALGAEYWQIDYATRWTIMMLYLVEYADWNVQTKIGQGGLVNSQYIEGTVRTTGQTDAMGYHTGTAAGRKTDMGECQYRYIEGLWDNGYEYVDGIIKNSGATGSGTYIYNIALNPSDFSNITTAGQAISFTVSDFGFNQNIKSWFIPSTTGYEWALLPQTIDSSGTLGSTYVSDACSMSNRDISMGGDAYNSDGYGLFAMYTTGYNNDQFGTCRLMKLPNS